MSSQASANAAEYNAKVQQQQADQQRVEAVYEEQRKRQEALRLRGTQEAGYAASGVTLEGSPLAVLEQTAVDSELDALSIRYGGAAKAQRSLAQARLDRYQASAARTQGYIEGGAQLLVCRRG
jgi:hypothetical protein